MHLCPSREDDARVRKFAQSRWIVKDGFVLCVTTGFVLECDYGDFVTSNYLWIC